jgi:fermentation-respiration switch protein FrsA (DUF1100 family)
MEKPRRWRRRIVRALLVLVVLVLVIGVIIMPIGLAVYVTVKPPEDVGPPPDGFQDVTLTTSDGVNLAAWYAPPANGAVIVVVHGSGGSRESMRDRSTMLVEQGFGVLAFDLRGHGASQGQTNLYGWEGTRDVGAALAFLEQQDGVEAIGGWGSSLGGEVLLGAAGDYPAMAAIVSDGASYRSFDEFDDLSMQRQNVFIVSIWLMFKWVRVFSGDSPPTSILDSIRAADSTQFLLIAGGSEETEVKYNELFAETIGDRATVWVAPGVGHTKAYGRYPDEYTQRVIDFFTATLLAG